MSKQDLIKYLVANNISVPVFSILVGLLCALLLALFAYLIYRVTYTGVMYSRDFGITVIMVSLVTCFIIMVIGSNLALSLGLVGALSIIRFRTAVKNSRDAAFLFWAIGIGLACGTSLYTIGILASIIIGAVLLVLSKWKIMEEFSYLLIVRGSQIESGKIEEVMRGRVKRHSVRMTNHFSGGEEFTYELLLKVPAGELIQELSEDFPSLDFHLVSYRGELSGE